VKSFRCGNFSQVKYQINYDFNGFNALLGFQPIDYFWDQKKSQSSAIFIEQILTNGSYERKPLVLDFKNMTQPIDITNSSRIPEFIARIPNNYYINGILNYEFIDKNRGTLFDAIILVNIEGINKFCITPEFDASKVRHLLIKEFFKRFHYS